MAKGTRTTVTFTPEAVEALKEIHEALAAVRKVQTYSDTINWLLLREAKRADELAPASVLYQVMDKAALDELKREIVEETKMSATYIIEQTIRGEIAQGFRSMLASLKK